MTSTKGLKVGVKLMRTQELYGGEIRGVLEVAKLCDRLGVDEVHVSDHVAMSEAGHRGRPGFPYPLDYDGWFEPIGLLHAIAAVTERVVLSSHVLVAPLRPTILLAKQLATLDALSNGRVEIGFGAGWQREEFEASGVPFEGRFGAMCEQVEACRALWSQAPASYSGGSVRFEAFHSLPFPPQRDGLPISFGVPATARNFERIARLGVGYCPAYKPAAELAADVQAARTAYAAAGRDPGSLKVTAELPLNPPRDAGGAVSWDALFEEAARIAEADVDVLITHVVPQCRTPAEIEDFLPRLLALRT
ncbi:TIGR03619 family F420-dependent LLM class oxidoreductase [Phenylobacterium sp.]|jgi:probable F420-dependent oxidoreductase|uniref:TIGR03619 family F420-dependent LLM class oxidoreductase n=1 Tax=Phenylobacterium sp. TaxID=1871053 RepID=UPI002F40EA72